MVANQEEKKVGMNSHRLTLVGEVVSDKMDKTIVVKTMRTFQHERLGKVMKATKKYKVHDERQEAKLGDIVEFYEGRPVAKTKYMYLARVVKKA
jgi:small subunit ribosomal protein S17